MHLKKDENGNIDWTGPTANPLNPFAKNLARQIQLQTNAIMSQLFAEYRNAKHHEVQRLIIAAMSSFEEGALWASKAIMSEYWDKAHKSQPFEIKPEK